MVQVWAHFFCFYGIFAVLDPLLVLIVDLIVGNYDCASQPICDVDISVRQPLQQYVLNDANKVIYQCRWKSAHSKLLLLCDHDVFCPQAEGCFCIEGDAFKLAVLTENQSNSAVVGILLTVAIYVLIAALTTVLLYQYFMFVYLNGE